MTKQCQIHYSILSDSATVFILASYFKIYPLFSHFWLCFLDSPTISWIPIWHCLWELFDAWSFIQALYTRWALCFLNSLFRCPICNEEVLGPFLLRCTDIWVIKRWRVLKPRHSRPFPRVRRRQFTSIFIPDAPFPLVMIFEIYLCPWGKNNETKQLTTLTAGDYSGAMSDHARDPELVSLKSVFCVLTC